MTVRLRTSARNMETKKEIRSRLKKQRGLLGAYECHNMSHDIYKRLIALELDREYDNILLYSAIRNEVHTDEYFTYLINKAKRIYYPRCKVLHDILCILHIVHRSHFRSSGSSCLSVLPLRLKFLNMCRIL